MLTGVDSSGFFDGVGTNKRNNRAAFMKSVKILLRPFMVLSLKYFG